MNRRQLLRACGTIAMLGTAGCNAPRREATTIDDRPGSEGPENWPMFLHGRTNRRCFPIASDVLEPSRDWSYGTDDAIWSSPVVADGTLYVGSYDGHLYAVSLETGDTLWRYRTGDRIDGSPAVANGTVYVGSHDRNVYALDAETGEERWIFGTKGIVRSSPTVGNGTVYIGSHCRTEECSVFYDVRWPKQGYVYAIDADTGVPEWRYETRDGVLSTPAVGGETVYVGSSDNTLYAFEASTGNPRWTYETSGSIMSSPVVADRRVHVGNVAGEVHAIDARTGDWLWTFDANRGFDSAIDLSVVITGSPVVCDGTVYVGSIVPDETVYGKLYAISASDGSGKWSASPFAQAIGSSPVVVNGVLYFGAHTFGPTEDASPGVFAVDEDGTERWSYTVDGTEHRGFGSSPAVVDGTLYIGSTDGHVHAFDLE
ncbi:MAG: outer membrane protein assembly factor BamB [Halobacteriales archaeon]|jgi:outer membrane protein assembly factor BamB